jgi:hypothetical protein
MSLLALYRRAKRTLNRGSFGVVAFVIVLVLAIAGCSSSDKEPDQEEAVLEVEKDNSLVTTGDSRTNPVEPTTVPQTNNEDLEGGFSIDSQTADNPSSNPQSLDNPTAGSDQAVDTPEPFPTLPIGEENNHLEEALALIPEDAFRLSFTHWNRLKRHNRVAQLTSEFSMEERRRFIVQVLKNNQASAIMDKEFITVQAELWGWDSTDLVWEAEAQFEEMLGYLNILKVRPNLELDNLVALLLGRDFTPVEYEGITIYSLPLTEKTDWYNISPLSVHNIAIFPNESLLIMSPIIELVQQAIDTMRDQVDSLGDNPLVRRAAFQLIGMAGVEMHVGEESCQSFSAGMSESSRIINAASDQLSNWPVAPYQLMALGHAFSNEAQVDLVVFHYEDFRQAEFDFEFRENLLRLGTSPKRNVPYSAQFILQDGELDDALMTFSLVPSPSLSDRSGWPQTVIGWVQDHDALFAACVVEDFLGLDEME